MNREGIKIHRALFEKWLEGATIQVLTTGLSPNEWRDTPYPVFSPDVEYRVKPDLDLFTCRIASSDILTVGIDDKDVELQIRTVECGDETCSSVFLTRDEALRLAKRIGEHAATL